MRKLVIGLAVLALCFAPLMATMNINVLSDYCDPVSHRGHCTYLSERGWFVFFITYEDLPSNFYTNDGNPVYNNCFDPNHDRILDIKWCLR